MGRRLVARLIDWFVIGLTIGLVCGVTFAVADSTDGFNGDQASPITLIAVVVALTVISLFPITYETAMIAKRGATLGKIVMRLRVIRLTDGRVPGIRCSLIRMLPPTIGGLVCTVGVFLVWLSPFFDRSPAQQGWHDILAKTMVIRDR